MLRPALFQAIELALVYALAFLAGFGAARHDWFGVAIGSAMSATAASGFVTDVAYRGLFGAKR